MRWKLFTSFGLGLAVLWGAGFTLAQTSSERTREPGTLIERLDNFGRTLFGGERSGDRERSSRSAASRPAADEPVPASRWSDRVVAPRAAPPAAPQTRRETAPIAAKSASLGAATPNRSPLRSEPAEQATSEAPAEPSAAAAPAATKDVPVLPGFAPIHERLGSARQSLFDSASDGPTSPAAGTAAAPAAEAETEATAPGVAETEPSSPDASAGVQVHIARPASDGLREPVPGAREPAVDVSLSPSPGAGQRRIAPTLAQRPRADTVAPQAAPASSPPRDEPASPVRVSVSGERPSVASSKSSTGPVARTFVSPPPVSGRARPSAAPSPAPAPAAEERGREPSTTKPTASSAAAVFSTQSAALSVETTGPRRIAVGKEGTYVVLVRNFGAVSAEQVVVTVDLPEWTEIAGAEASAGTTGVSKRAIQPAQLRWTLARLEAHGQQTLTLRIIPRQSRPFDLAAKCDYVPPASQARIEVQEPKLALALHGPRAVAYGKAETYKLEVANPGTAEAENVQVTLSPSSPGERLPPATHPFGTLAAGQKKTVAMELTARQDGNLAIQVEARADGGVRAQLAQEILVQRARLKMDVEAPRIVYAGNDLTYRIRLRNEGNAPAEGVKLRAAMPPGAKYVSSPQDGQLTRDQNNVGWMVGKLNPGSETALVLTCQTATAGVNRLDVQCVQQDESPLTASATTQVETAPNLVLAIEEPPGPVALGGEAAYQVLLQNRGTASAEGVEVVIYFADHVEPVAAEGARHRLSSGQVVFESVPSLPPGQSATFKVKAKADQAGNHVYRIEIHAKSTGVRMVREGTTRFYAATAATESPDAGSPLNEAPASAPRGLRTADRREGPTPAGENR